MKQRLQGAMLLGLEFRAIEFLHLGLHPRVHGRMFIQAPNLRAPEGSFEISVS